MSVEVLSTAAQVYEKSHLKRLEIGDWPWISFKVIGIAILHCYWDISTFAVYVTDCDLEKIFRLENVNKISSPVHFLIHM